MHKTIVPNSRCGQQRTLRMRLQNSGNATESGQSFVELALILPIFFSLVVGLAEFALLTYAYIEVQSAAHAAAEYGAQSHVTAADIAGMQQAALNDGINVSGLSAAASNSCACWDGTTSTAIACTNFTGCTSPAHLIMSVQVNTTAPIVPAIRLPGLPQTFTLHGSAVMRVEQ